ncbi:MAG TPA: hypothetical protein VKG02_15685 [Blastocatellia bacterium]|nr:hypothetical protein [Blastocatellia bacterium]
MAYNNGTQVAAKVTSAMWQAPTNYALLIKNDSIGPIVAEENYEKDFRISGSGGLHAGQRDRLRLSAQTSRQSDGGIQEKEEETQTSP